jgi:hypothetical protein
MEKKQPVTGKVFVTKHTRKAYDGLERETYSISVQGGDEVNDLSIEDILLIQGMIQEFVQGTRQNKKITFQE